MGKKLGITLTCTLLGAGVIGGICYQDIPAFKTGVNEFFENASNINISINKDKDSTNDENEVKPITPQEFLKTYKFELPVSFLGGNLYVKKLANNNLLVSSSVGKGILFCNTETEQTILFELNFIGGSYFHEMSNGNCYISSSSYTSYAGLLYFDAQNISISKIFESGFSYYGFVELPNGEALISSSTSSLLLHVKLDGSVASYNLKISNMFVLPDGNCLMYQASVGYGKFYLEDGSFAPIENVPQNISTSGIKIDCGNGNGVLYSSGNTSSQAGVYAYVYETNSFIQLYASGYYFNYVSKLSNGKYLLSSYASNYFTGCLLLDCNSLTASLISDVKTKYLLIAESDDSCLICSCADVNTPNSLYLLTFEDNKCTELLSNNNGFNSHNLEDGSILFYVLSSISSAFNVAGFYIFDVTSNKIINPCTQGYNFTIIEELDNGNLLLAGTIDINKGYKGLYYFDKDSETTTLLLYNNEVSGIKKQSDGTYYITTVDEFDYEFDPINETIKIVYAVEIE